MKGLVHAYLLDGKGGGEAIEWSKVNLWSPESGLMWLHMDYSDQEAMEWLKAESGLDPGISDALTEEATRPRLLVNGESLLLVLRGVNFNPGADPEDMVSLRMWVEKSRIITLRQRRVMALEDISGSIERGNAPIDAGDFIIKIIERITGRMSDVIDDVIDQVDELEESVISSHAGELRNQLSSVRRQVISLRRHIAPQRDTLIKLGSSSLNLLKDENKFLIRESIEKTIRYIEDLDVSREKAMVTHEELNSKLAEETSKTMYLLSIIAAIFLPLSFITGLLGINVAGIPGSEYEGAFIWVCYLLLAIGVIQLVIFRLRRWI